LPLLFFGRANLASRNHLAVLWEVPVDTLCERLFVGEGAVREPSGDDDPDTAAIVVGTVDEGVAYQLAIGRRQRHAVVDAKLPTKAVRIVAVSHWRRMTIDRRPSNISRLFCREMP